MDTLKPNLIVLTTTMKTVIHRLIHNIDQEKGVRPSPDEKELQSIISFKLSDQGWVCSLSVNKNKMETNLVLLIPKKCTMSTWTSHSTLS